MDDQQTAPSRTVHPIVTEALRVLTHEGDRSHAPAKMRLAVSIGYNIHSVLHWAAGRRQPNPDAVTRMETIVSGGR